MELVTAEREARSDVHPAQKFLISILKGFAVAALVAGLVRALLSCYLPVLLPCGQAVSKPT